MGQVGAPNFVYPKSNFFCDLKPHAKFRNTTITPSGRKVSEAEEERKRKNKQTKNWGGPPLPPVGGFFSFFSPKKRKVLRIA